MSSSSSSCSSICSSKRALCSERLPYNWRRSFSISSLRWLIRASVLERSAIALAASALALAASAWAPAASASARSRAARSARIIACAATRSVVTMESHPPPSASQKHYPTDVGRHVSCAR